jgi:hypothetical protein
MKHQFLTGVAVVAALAFSAPVWAQQANPSGGNSMGTPGPNPGGPGLTPYSTGPNPGGSALSGPRSTPSTPPGAMAPSATPPYSTSDTSSATPPKHYRAPRHAYHGKMAGHHRGKYEKVTGSTADHLNQEELARLQSGNYSNPPAPGKSYPSGSAPPSYQPSMGTTGGGAPYRP